MRWIILGIAISTPIILTVPVAVAAWTSMDMTTLVTSRTAKDTGNATDVVSKHVRTIFNGGKYMADFLKGVLVTLMIVLYVVSPLDFFPGPLMISQ